MPMDQIFTASDVRSKMSQVVLACSAQGRAMAVMAVNDTAFAFKALAPVVIGEHRKIRSPSFIKSRFLVDKAKPGTIADMRAVAGSIHSDRFSGFS